MRIARLLGVILTLVTLGLSGGLLVAPVAAAEPPFRLSEQVSDRAQVLSDAQRSAVTAAVNELYIQRRVRLWVVYVDDFSGVNAETWAKRTFSASELGSYDALLAVGTTSRSYAFLVSSAVKNINAAEVDALRRDKIEPALRDKDFSGAAIIAADGLNRAPHQAGTQTLLVVVVVLGVIAAALLLLVIVTRYRRKRRRARELDAARRVDPTDARALAAVPLQALDDLSREKVVEVDNAVRTSANELALAVEEFGPQRTEPFTNAVTSARAALSKALTVRQQLDDHSAAPPAVRRELLTEVITTAARADRELESQTESFEGLRDLVISAPSLLDGLTRQYVELSGRIGPTEQRMAGLREEFDAQALTSVDGNVATATERLGFADRNISAARDLAGRAQSGQQGGLVDAYRAAESALGQARALLDAVDSAADNIRLAIANLPATITDVTAAIEQASGRLQQHANSVQTAELLAARDAAARALEDARGAVDPLTAFTHLTKAEADLDHELAAVAAEDANAERLERSFDQAVFTAESRVRGVSDYIDTRRGSVGPDARTKLDEATRHLAAARAKKSTNIVEAISHANLASALASQAQGLANADVQSAQRAYAGRGDSGDAGAMLGGIIIGDLLSGGLRGGGSRGGGGGWSPTSFGGSSGGGFMGGGGRF